MCKRRIRVVPIGILSTYAVIFLFFIYQSNATKQAMYLWTVTGVFFMKRRIRPCEL